MANQKSNTNQIDDRTILEMLGSLFSNPQVQQAGGALQNLTSPATSMPGLISGMLQSQPNVQGNQLQDVINQQLNPMAKPQLGSYQKGVDKALKEGGYNHTQEALQAGVPAQHIEQESGLTQLQQQQQTTAPNATPEQAQQSQLTMNPPSGPLAMGGATIKDGQVSVNQTSPAMKFLMNWIGMGQNSFANQDLSTISGAQKVAGQEPIQPIEKQQRQAAIYSAQIQAYNDAITKEEAMQTGIKGQLEILQKSNPLAIFTPQWKALNDEMLVSRKRALNANKQFGKLANNPPKTGKQENIPKGATHYSPSKNKYYDAQGNEVK